MREITLAAIRMDAAPAATRLRLERADNLVKQAAVQGAQIAVLPELFNTGYEYHERNYTLAEPMDGQTVGWLKAAARQHNLYLAGTLLLRDGPDIYNAMLLVAPGGQTWRYDKSYPYGWERAYFRPRTQAIAAAETELGKIGMLICWDIAHPDLWEAYAGRVDLMLVSSCPWLPYDARSHFPDGTSIRPRECGPIMKETFRNGEKLFGQYILQQAAWLSVPLVATTGAGRFRSFVPSPIRSLAMAIMTRPKLWKYLLRAKEVYVESGFSDETLIADANGQVLSRASLNEDNLTVSAVQLSETTPTPRGRRPRIDLSPLAYWADAMTNRWQVPTYRRNRQAQLSKSGVRGISALSPETNSKGERMDTHDDVYRKLQHEINKLPVPFPETDTGVELRLLKHLFTPEEAEIALNLNLLPETLPRIHKRMTRNGLTISIEELEKTLDNLVTKGAILGGGLFESKGKGKQYSLSQLAVGMFECQVNRLSREYVEDFHQYFKTAFHKAFFGTRTGQMRTVPIGSSITPELCVEPYDDMKSYVKTLNDDMAVANCVCRQSSDVAGNKCRHSDIRETCLSFGDTARFVLGRGVARRISKEEALAILDRAEEAGFILQSENARAPQYICCCCSDCCHLIAGLKMFPRPAEHFQTSYLAVVDESLCNGCEECVDKCGMEAIRMQDEVCVTDLDRCLGCGVCVAACATGARTLRKKDKKHVPPQTHDTLYGKIMLERFGVVGTVKAMSKALLGRKV